ncbi:condensation domain-containing protein, partial [Clostridia bacterium OttesenSCG-928-F22]|nr:condensation domain-containing protein [Clostridia bacterium OttesenSCG-928-F22]
MSLGKEIIYEPLDRRLFPLSMSQRNIWNVEQVYSGVAINNICATMRINGRMDIPLLQKSLNMVVASDASLRIQLTMQDGEICQYEAPYEEV